MAFESLHHGPVGSWSSLYFGALGRGVNLLHEPMPAGSAGLEANADLLVAVQRGDGVTALPFVRNAGAYAGWRFAGSGDVARNVSACVDEFAVASAGLTLRGYHDGRELNEGQEFAPCVRQLDKQVLYAFCQA